MIIPDENLWSRRTFVKTALAGAATTLIAPFDAHAGYLHVRYLQQADGSRPSTLSLSDASQLVRNKKVSPVELTQECLKRIEEFNPKLNVFITITADSAMAEAHQAEAEIQQGRWRGPLHGIPIALKDMVDTAGVRTTAASGLFKDRIPTQDAEIVRRLKATGAVLLGKTNLHEFAYGGSSAISYFGSVRNPWNPRYSPGGSSGGSAAAVAAQLCYGSIGTDTGGSIREPASYCGIVGFKPTYGRVSTTGLLPLAWSLDHVGPMTSTALDAALMLQVIAGYDPRDPGSINLPIPDYAANIAASISSLRLGVARGYFYDELHPDVEAAMEVALSVLKKLTGTQRDIAPLASDGTYSTVTNTALTILMAESYDFHREYISKNPELYQEATAKRIRDGANVTISAYMQSRRQLDQVRHFVTQVFDSVDLVITPTTRIPPFPIADLTDPDTARPKEVLMLHNTRPFNVLALPTISVPCGFTAQGLPVGMQISGPPGAEPTVLRLAHAYEQATEWHKRKPNLR